MSRKPLVVVFCLLLGGCVDYDACTPESSEKVGKQLARCLQGDGQFRPSAKVCAYRAVRYCERVAP